MTPSIAPSPPPGPQLPKWAQTLGFALARVPFTEMCRRRYGEVVRFHTLFGSKLVVVFDPQLVRQMFRASPGQLGPANQRLQPLVGENSLFVRHGTGHMHQRKLLLPPFHGERVRAHESHVRLAADRAIDSWPVGQPFALLPWMQSVTLDVIMLAVFGLDGGSRLEELKRRVRATLDPGFAPLALLVPALRPGRLGGDRGFESRRRLMDELVYDEIARRRAEPGLEDREDVLSMLLLARDENGKALADGEVRDELVTLVFAGHETTAIALAWAFELLQRNARVLGRLRRELAADDDAYLQAVVKETLRLRPVVWGVGRVVREEPFEVGGHLIPVGDEVHFSIAGIHRRPDCYPEPRRFRPERFLGADVPDTYTWVPFGGGTRRCLGASFAMLEMAGVIQRVLERTSLVPADRRPEKGVRRGIFFVPRRGVRVMQLEAPQGAATLDGEPGW